MWLTGWSVVFVWSALTDWVAFNGDAESTADGDEDEVSFETPVAADRDELLAGSDFNMLLHAQGDKRATGYG